MPVAPKPLTGDDFTLIAKALDTHAREREGLYYSVMPRQREWMAEVRAARRLARRIEKGAR
jgi:cob(I)alamin adenosyltransferase